MLSVAILAFLIALEPPRERCSVAPLRGNPEGYFWPLADIEDFVRSSDLVVRVRADSTVRNPAGATPYHHSRVHFTVLEVLHGVTPADLWVHGRFVEHDDFNPLRVPYRMVRPSGQRGGCFTDEYRRGAEYVLLMRQLPHVIPLISEVEEVTLNPYWAALAPLNEQVRGRDDPWVRWVRVTLGDRSH